MMKPAVGNASTLYSVTYADYATQRNAVQRRAVQVYPQFSQQVAQARVAGASG